MRQSLEPRAAMNPVQHTRLRPLRNLKRNARAFADRSVLSLANVAVYFGDGTKQPTIGSAPCNTVFERGKLRLLRLRRAASVEFELGHATHRVDAPAVRTPVLVIPPLMVRPYIYDLRPEHSMLRTLRNAGFDRVAGTSRFYSGHAESSGTGF